MIKSAKYGKKGKTGNLKPLPENRKFLNSL